MQLVVQDQGQGKNKPGQSDAERGQDRQTPVKGRAKHIRIRKQQTIGRETRGADQRGRGQVRLSPDQPGHDAGPGEEKDGGQQEKRVQSHAGHYPFPAGPTEMISSGTFSPPGRTTRRG